MDRTAALVLMQTGDGPAAHHLIYRAAVIQEALVVTEGQLIGVAERDNVRNVRAGHRALPFWIVVILRKGASIDCIFGTGGGAVVGVHTADGFREGVGEQESQAVRVALLQAGLQGVVGDAADGVQRIIDVSILWIGAQRLTRSGTGTKSIREAGPGIIDACSLHARIVDGQREERADRQAGSGGGRRVLGDGGGRDLIWLGPDAEVIGMHANVADAADDARGILMLHLKAPVELRWRLTGFGVDQRRIVVADEETRIKRRAANGGWREPAVPVVGRGANVIRGAIGSGETGEAEGVFPPAHAIFQIVVADRPGDGKAAAEGGALICTGRVCKADARLNTLPVDVADACLPIAARSLAVEGEGAGEPARGRVG